MKGATKFDQLCHSVFAANGNGTNYLGCRTGVQCGCCGYELKAYYCEERLCKAFSLDYYIKESLRKEMEK